MSGTNAISGIVLVGALVVAGASESALSQAMAIAAVVLAAINVFGGFLVTDRMLQMFRREGPGA
jgi:NAD(P) transhydrogenase subunit alpha